MNGSNLTEINCDVSGLNRKARENTSFAVNGSKTSEYAKNVTSLNNDELIDSQHIVNSLNSDRIIPVVISTNTIVNQEVTGIKASESPKTAHTIIQDANDSLRNSEILPDIEVIQSSIDMSEPVHSETPSVSGIAAAKTDLILNSSSDTIGDLFLCVNRKKPYITCGKKMPSHVSQWSMCFEWTRTTSIPCLNQSPVGLILTHILP